MGKKKVDFSAMGSGKKNNFLSVDQSKGTKSYGNNMKATVVNHKQVNMKRSSSK